MSHSMKLLRHLWNGHRGMNSLLNWISTARDNPPTPQSSARKTTDTRETPSSSSKQLFGPHSEQPVEDIAMPDTVNISDTEDIGSAHLLKIKPRPEWLKPIPEEDRPESLEPDWSVPPNDLLKLENNWANALAKSYKYLAENKLLRKTGDMGSFIKWFCKRLGKKQLCKSDLEVDLVNLEGHRLVPDVSKPLPRGGPPGQVTIQPQFFFNKDLEYLTSCDTASRDSLSISKLKVAIYPNFGLEELVPSLWIESERDYNISAAYVSSVSRNLKDTVIPFGKRLLSAEQMVTDIKKDKNKAKTGQNQARD
ncbi:hypothetical protein Tco_0925566 [Tanacetum coccineum]|uniref:Uncharacterized protein n=1 Tax=Tanacetum coccineum TaxID=301880 RepID=A0ABQ5D9U3_9ASTR